MESPPLASIREGGGPSIEAKKLSVEERLAETFDSTALTMLHRLSNQLITMNVRIKTLEAQLDMLAADKTKDARAAYAARVAAGSEPNDLILWKDKP